jgi:predicted acetylornithine/succinylornithine family transaminase
MPSTLELLRFGREHLFPTHARPDLVIAAGQGPWLFDTEGNRYLDFSGGLSANALGHAHPALARAIAQQAARFGHISSLFYNDQTAQLAHELCAHSFADAVFFTNSGTESNEAAIKVARRWFFARGESRFEVVAAIDSFHGRTLGSLAATGQPHYHQGFEPLPAGFDHVAYGDIQGLRSRVSRRTALVMLEPMQGEGGIIIPPPGYLAEVRDVCREVDCLLHFDEVQVGLGRTGKLFCYEHEGVEPDTMSLAKALGGGLPLGALLARDEIARVMTPGTHASTFGGNPIACAAGLETLRLLAEEGLVERSAQIGNRALEMLGQALRGCTAVADIRGRGCLLGIELNAPSDAVLDGLRERRILASVVRRNVLRLAPPFTIPLDVLDEGLAAVIAVLSDPRLMRQERAQTLRSPVWPAEASKEQP